MQRKLEVGKFLANELLFLNGFSAITTNDRQVIDRTVWKMFPELITLRHKHLIRFAEAEEYCLLQFKTGRTLRMQTFMNDNSIKERIYQGRLTILTPFPLFCDKNFFQVVVIYYQLRINHSTSKLD